MARGAYSAAPPPEARAQEADELALSDEDWQIAAFEMLLSMQESAEVNKDAGPVASLRVALGISGRRFRHLAAAARLGTDHDLGAARYSTTALAEDPPQRRAPETARPGSIAYELAALRAAGLRADQFFGGDIAELQAFYRRRAGAALASLAELLRDSPEPLDVDGAQMGREAALAAARERLLDLGLEHVFSLRRPEEMRPEGYRRALDRALRFPLLPLLAALGPVRDPLGAPHGPRTRWRQFGTLLAACLPAPEPPSPSGGAETDEEGGEEPPEGEGEGQGGYGPLALPRGAKEAVEAAAAAWGIPPRLRHLALARALLGRLADGRVDPRGPGAALPGALEARLLCGPCPPPFDAIERDAARDKSRSRKY
eukprot:tig00020902_g15041.t1